MRERAAIVLAALFAVLAAWVSQHSLPGDGDVADALDPFRARLADLAQLFTLLGDPLVALLTVAALAAIAARRAGVRAAALIVLASTVVVGAAAVKHIVGPTPDWIGAGHGDSLNFPSGHVAYATALSTAVALLARPPRDRDAAAARIACSRH
jgi:undecaprenyl-diphosphatase